MEYILKEKIRIGISACNFGASVRWNMKGWDRIQAIARQKTDYIWTPVCPEIMSGFGVPRAPVRLVSGNGDDFWQSKARVKNRLGKDVSADIKTGALSTLEIIKQAGCDAFAFMEGSPSCGVYRTSLKEKRLGKPPGVFGALLLKEDLFLIPALDIESPWKWWDWSRRLCAFVWLKRQPVRSKAELYAIWHELKFICQEADVVKAKEIGSGIADAPKKITAEYIAQCKSEIFKLVRLPSTLSRISAVMIKHYAHYRKQFGLKATDVTAPSTERGRHAFVEALQKMERKAVDQGYHFAGNPVAYRPSRNS